MRPHLAVLVVPALSLGLAACGDQTKDVEKSVASVLGERGYPGSSVDCPSEVDVKAGTTFDCTVTGSELTKVTIRINDDEGQDLTLESAEGGAAGKGRAGGGAG